MLTLKKPPQLTLSKARSTSLSNKPPFPTNFDPFSLLLKQGNKLKPVSPKMRFPKNTIGLPPRPLKKENTVKIILFDENDRISTPNFKEHSKNNGSLTDLKKLRRNNEKVCKMTENEFTKFEVLSPIKIKHKSMKSY